MRALPLIVVAFAVVGCSTIDDFGPEYGLVVCDGVGEVNILTDPRYCGGCTPVHDVCAEGVACIDGRCDYTSILHCGAKDRICMGFEGADGVACIPVPEGIDASIPEHGPVVGGHACAPIFIPGQSEGCRQNLPDRCHTATIEFTDICGETCTLPFADDLEAMTTEVSRGLYRDVMCDCDRVRTRECAHVCTARGPSVDMLPMTGLNACGAEQVCAALGARLPTALERARVQQIAAVDPALFEEMSCDDWRDRIGSAPRVRECIDSGAPLDLVAVDDPRGAIPLGAGVLPTPRLLHHFVGNANEWLASRAAGLTCAALRGEASDVTIEWSDLHTVQGRSVLSPEAQVWDRLLAVTPDIRTTELGVRCIRSASQPALNELPRLADACDWSHPVGETPVRLGVSDRVYRATEACIDAAPGGGDDVFLFAPIAGSFVSATPLFWHQQGDTIRIGQAWSAQDEQWWLSPPTRLHETLTVQTDDLNEFNLVWARNEVNSAGRCAHLADTAADHDGDGKIVRLLAFELDRRALSVFSRYGVSASAVCGIFECIDGSISAARCAEDCQRWLVPIVISWIQVEAFNRFGLCN